MPAEGVHDRILQMLDDGAMGGVAQLNPTNQVLIGERYYSRLIRILAPFEVDGDTLLQLLHKHRAIISGSVALLLVHPRIFEAGDIDIYVPTHYAILFLMDLLRCFPSYKFDYADRRKQNSYVYNESLNIRSVHRLFNDSTSKSINLIVVHGDNPIESIFYFDATHMMNFITAFGFGCAYPQLTLDSQAIRLRDDHPRHEWLVKQADRGFQLASSLQDMVPPVAHSCSIHPSCPLTSRHLRDSHMFYGSFKPDRSPLRHALHNFSGNSTWRLSAPCGPIRGSVSGQPNRLARLSPVWGDGHFFHNIET